MDDHMLLMLPDNHPRLDCTRLPMPAGGGGGSLLMLLDNHPRLDCT